ncbi:MAG: hypothetical protein AAB403_12455, partial [Planctomycetota bacterium]
HEPSEFIQRVRTTIEFLRQVYSDELSFSQPRTTAGTVAASSVRATLAALQLPWISKSLAQCLKIRLEQLKNQGYLHNVVTPGNWASLINDSVLNQILALPKFLGPIEQAGTEGAPSGLPKQHSKDAAAS